MHSFTKKALILIRINFSNLHGRFSRITILKNLHQTLASDCACVVERLYSALHRTCKRVGKARRRRKERAMSKIEPAITCHSRYAKAQPGRLQKNQTCEKKVILNFLASLKLQGSLERKTKSSSIILKKLKI